MPLEEQPSWDEVLQKARGISATPAATNPLAPAAPPVFSTSGEDISPIFPPEFSDAYRQAEFVKENKQPGVPLDVESGAPWTQRFSASFRRDPEQVVKYWQDKYGEDNVRLTKGGDLIVRTQDEKTKQPKDILVDERNFTMKDFADFAGTMPEIAATAASIWATKKIPGPIGQAKGLGGLIRDIVAGNTGTFLGGTIKDVLARAADEQHPIDTLPQVMAERAGEIPFNTVTDFGVAGVGKVLGKVITPFNKVGPLQEDAREAANWVKDNLGINYPMTAGQKTGSPFIQRLEAGQELKPGSSAPYKAIRAEQQAAQEQMANVAQGLPANVSAAQREAQVPVLDTLIRRVRNAVQQNLEPAEQNVANAREKLVTEANQDILKEISSATIPHRQLDRGVVGEAIRGKVEAIRQDFSDQASKLYDAVRNLPGGSDRILATPNLVKRAQDYLEKEIAGSDILQTVPTGLYGPTGQALTTQQTVKETAKEFIPTDVLGRLKELVRVGPGKFSLQDLIAMRNDVSNAIAVGEAVPGVQTHHLKKISQMLTDSMDEAVSSIPDQRLKQAWKAANDYYKQNVGKFHTRLVSSILKPPEAGGSLGNRQIVDRLISGEDKFQEIKDFLGANSPEYKMLKGHIAEFLFSDNLNRGTGLLNAKKFLSDMHSFAVNQPKLFDEVFSTRARKIFEIASHAAAGQSDKLDAALIEQGIRNPSRFPNILELMKAERARDKAYKNEILKSIGSKSFPASGFSPNEFVTRFLRSSSASEIKPVMEAIKDGGLLWQVRAKTVEDLLQEVARNPTAADRVAMRLDPRRPLNTIKLQEILQNRERREALETIIGKDKVELLERMGQLLKPSEAQHMAFRTAASLQVGAQVSMLERGGIFQFIGGAVRNTLEALFLTMPGIRQWAGNTVMTPTRQAALTATLLSMEPVISAFKDDFGKDYQKAINQVKQRNDEWMKLHYDPRTAPSMPGTNDARALRVLRAQ